MSEVGRGRRDAEVGKGHWDVGASRRLRRGHELTTISLRARMVESGGERLHAVRSRERRRRRRCLEEGLTAPP